MSDQPISQPIYRRAEVVTSEQLYSEYQRCHRWSLIVGISRYQYQNWNLQYADRDAEAFYQLLLTPNGGKFEERRICKLVNDQASTGKVTQALRSFLQKPAQEDLVILYFACHGSPDPYRPDNLYLLTHDTDPADIAGTAVPMREVKQAVTENLHAEKVIILADTCHSGGISSSGRRTVTDDSTLINRYLQELSQAMKGVATFTSAEPRQVAQEGTRWGGGHGVFTHYLLEGMRGAADRDRNGIITIGELFEYVRECVRRDTEDRQHPLISSDGFDRDLPIALVTQKQQPGEQLLDTTRQNEVLNSRILTPQIHKLFSSKINNFEFRVILVNEFGQLVKQYQQIAECFVEGLDNEIMLEMIFVPGGSFLMGAPETESKRYTDERPQHQVEVKPFLMSKYPITNAQWSSIASLQPIHRKLKRRPSRHMAINHPVVEISWHDAIEFCNRLSEKVKKDYRLASEAEWEYACRAGVQKPFHFGETITSDIVNCDGTFSYRSAPKGIKREKTTSVGSFQVANFFGLFDMHGNVWEWCLDHWHKDYDNAPVLGKAWIDSTENNNRVLRGGSWRNDPIRCRSAARWYGHVDDRAGNIGFRIVLPL